jgi:hypothetical protein
MKKKVKEEIEKLGLTFLVSFSAKKKTWMLYIQINKLLRVSMPQSSLTCFHNQNTINFFCQIFNETRI